MLIGVGVFTWIFLSILIAFAGRKFRFGFWGYFFGSMLLTPAIGLLMLLAAIPPRAPAHK